MTVLIVLVGLVHSKNCHSGGNLWDGSRFVINSTRSLLDDKSILLTFLVSSVIQEACPLKARNLNDGLKKV
jgi:N-acyl-L-homoserine lactone synthetase